MPIQVALSILVILFFTGAFLKNPWLVIISVAAGVILLTAAWWNKKALQGVTYKRRWHYRRGFPGEQTEMHVEVENKKALPLSWLRVSDLFPLGAPPKGEETLKASHLPGFGKLINLFSLRWFEKISRRYEVEFRTRGVYSVGPAEIASGDLFGLFETKKTLEEKENLTVFPEILPLNALDIQTENPLGEQSSRKRLFEDPNQPMGVRAYQPEDEFRRIHWAATARTGELQVKVYQPVRSKSIVICLNIATSLQPWLGINQGLSEHLIKLAATYCYQHVQQGYSVGLISNSCLSHSDQPFIIQPSRSPNQLALLLESLARITLFVTTPFEVFLTRTLPRLPFGASLVLISALVPPTLCESLMRIKRYRANTTLVSLDPTPPPRLPGIHLIHLPYSCSEAGRRE